MKRTWNTPELAELDVKATAFGLENPQNPDSEKSQVQIDGKWGYQQLFGEEDASK